VPFLCLEALPGDTYNVKVTALARLATPLKPIMDNMFMETFFFSVPIRQIWENWERFNGEQSNPGASIDYVIPQIIAAAGIPEDNIHDHMGIPIGIPNTTFNALHSRAYNHIFNNWFRDQNLRTALPHHVDNGPDNLTDYALLRRRKRADYFTSCLPWPQKGDEISVPIAGEAMVFTDAAPAAEIQIGDDLAGFARLGSGAAFVTAGGGDGGPVNLFADLTSATGISINDLRQSFQIQKLQERDARGGTRYPEILKSHFGVSDPQMLVLQRPEFLGGGSTPVNINPVAQTSDQISGGPGAETPQGNLAAYGTVHLRNHGFTKSFTEHCVILGIVNVRADLTYQQGMERMWSRRTRYDYFWPALAHLGEQAVLNQEIYYADPSDTLPGGNNQNSTPFGYQERYAEYRYKPSLITGLFRSTSVESLDIWHLSQEFTELPTLAQEFIEDHPPIPRVLAVQDEPEFLFDSYIQIKAARPMPLYGTPGLIDHF